MNMVKIIISLLTHLGWKLQQFDVKKVVLQGHLEEEVYMEITTGFGYIEEKNKVYRLKTALSNHYCFVWETYSGYHFPEYRQSQGDHTLVIKHSLEGKLFLS